MNLWDWFDEAQWWEIGLVSLVLNVGTVATSVLLFRLVIQRRSATDLIRRPTRRDWVLTASTTAVNTAAILPPWWLWSRGTLELPAPSLWIIVEVAYLAIALDTAMYLIHRLFHQGLLFRWFHSVHHTDDRPSCDLTLFVMHPAEAAGFGTVVAILLVLWPVSIVAVALFFFVNLVIGTAAHIPNLAAGRWDTTLGGSRLHQTHHDHPNSNFGFFTQFWDRALGTFR